jgi:hypothetical protein
VPTVACEKVNVGEPARVTSSEPCTPERPGDTGIDILSFAAVVPSYTLLLAVKVPVMVTLRDVMFAVLVAVVFHV